ncbi:HNH endonuclease [Pseudomonas brassicacearum]|uniref:HNH endonuclease n=1 Tax=Pseudomonas brassicacearum TaxID=930166 RepID=UPI0015E77BF2|nr:HNH endonuclease [Pseudomonas brassicacearum]
MADLCELISNISTLDSGFGSRLKVENQCIVYSGYRSRDGYGKVNRKGKVHFAHRYLWSLLNGSPSAEERVLHHCDNPPCCNPMHLFLGTQLDNMQDMRSKGRGRWVSQRGRPGHKGESNPKAKLTADQVQWIRNHYSSKYGSPFGSARLGEKFGVSRNTILHVVKGQTWRAI